ATRLQPEDMARHHPAAAHERAGIRHRLPVLFGPAPLVCGPEENAAHRPLQCQTGVRATACPADEDPARLATAHVSVSASAGAVADELAVGRCRDDLGRMAIVHRPGAEM